MMDDSVERPEKRCIMCGRAYHTDLIISDRMWKLISPGLPGVTHYRECCVTCLAAEVAALPHNKGTHTDVIFMIDGWVCDMTPSQQKSIKELLTRK